MFPIHTIDQFSNCAVDLQITHIITQVTEKPFPVSVKIELFGIVFYSDLLRLAKKKGVKDPQIFIVCQTPNGIQNLGHIQVISTVTQLSDSELIFVAVTEDNFLEVCAVDEISISSIQFWAIDGSRYFLYAKGEQ